jgi:hypothetical protein
MKTAHPSHPSHPIPNNITITHSHNTTCTPSSIARAPLASSKLPRPQSAHGVRCPGSSAPPLLCCASRPGAQLALEAARLGDARGRLGDDFFRPLPANQPRPAIANRWAHWSCSGGGREGQREKDGASARAALSSPPFDPRLLRRVPVAARALENEMCLPALAFAPQRESGAATTGEDESERSIRRGCSSCCLFGGRARVLAWLLSTSRRRGWGEAARARRQRKNQNHQLHCTQGPREGEAGAGADRDRVGRQRKLLTRANEREATIVSPPCESSADMLSSSCFLPAPALTIVLPRSSPPSRCASRFFPSWWWRSSARAAF